jgi:hypothetical protein
MAAVLLAFPAARVVRRIAPPALAAPPPDDGALAAARRRLVGRHVRHRVSGRVGAVSAVRRAADRIEAKFWSRDGAADALRHDWVAAPLLDLRFGPRFES